MGILKEASREQELTKLAKQTDSEIRGRLKSVDRDMVTVLKLLARMRRQGLWRHIGFRNFNAYIKSVHNELAHSRTQLYDLLAIHELTEGEKAIPDDVIKKMGVKKAVELTRLPEHQRTPEVVQMALEKPLSSFRNVITVKRNEELPLDQQKPLTRTFATLLPISVWAELEELLDEMQYMEGVRDGDDTWTLKQKAMHALIIAGREYYETELNKAREYKLAEDGMAEALAGQSLDIEDEGDYTEQASPTEDL